jgi:Bifunctional DNA primase/polymerase, N-terminal
MTSHHERVAQQYAAAGWPVFPCIPGEKMPVTPHGYKDATTDPERISDWWRKNPARNVAIATGAPGPDVVDVDNHGQAGNGFAAWNRAERAGLVSGPLAVVSTPSGGVHAYFRGTDQRSGTIRGCHLDFRSQGGYVVAPPSTVAGRRYHVVRHDASDVTVDFGAIRSLLNPQPERRPQRQRQAADGPRDISRLAGWVAARQPGDRNFPLFYASKQAALSGLLDAEGVERLVEASLRSGLRGGEREARRTIESGRRDAQRAEAIHRAGEQEGPRPFPEREREAG